MPVVRRERSVDGEDRRTRNKMSPNEASHEISLQQETAVFSSFATLHLADLDYQNKLFPQTVPELLQLMCTSVVSCKPTNPFVLITRFIRSFQNQTLKSR